MADSLRNRLSHAWNAFTGRETKADYSLGTSYAYSASRSIRTVRNDRSITNTIFNQIAIDVSAINIRHVRTGQNGRFESEMASGLNDCLKIRANLDQTGRAFIQDAVLSLFDLGVIAIVPVDTTVDIRSSNAYDVRSLRVGKITQWFPKHVKCEIYNERDGQRHEVVLPKNSVAIVENPLYEVINKPNSTLERLARKLSLLDTIDEAASSGKLDLIIQLPYVIKSDARRELAEKRRNDIEEQLKNSAYGIAYTDGTERITQLNRPAENNLLAQIKYLTTELYSRLGLTEAVFKGTATEAEMTNYHNRTVRPVLDAITEAMHSVFLTKTARTQGQAIVYMQDPLRLVTASSLIASADALIRNEVLTSNEIRSLLGYPPSSDSAADDLRNPNINPHDSAADEEYSEDGDAYEDEYAEDGEFEEEVPGLTPISSIMLQ